MLPLQCSEPTETDPLPLDSFYRLCFHYINGVFAVKTPHEEVDVVCISKAWSRPSFSLNKDLVSCYLPVNPVQIKIRKTASKMQSRYLT
jgi:hypothetical protein